ncbi:MAG TPA: vWA domain-containing protein, partial [Acidimicrobiales bacterium]|nr:vWA domain-containing protein [Acidimicrobiales bacterium]
MSYTAEISRANPTCFVFLIDQSLSMSDPIGGAAVPMRKADAVAEAINGFLSELCIKCAKEDGVRDYFHVAVIGYGADVGPAFRGRLAGRWLVPLSEVAAAPYRLEERLPTGVAAGAVREASAISARATASAVAERPVRVPVWFEPTAFGDTPMRAALAGAHAVMREWLAIHPGCFPPIVLNITDGESTDGDPSPIAADIRELVSADGPVLLFNLHLSEDRSDPIAFPSE